MLSSGWVSSNAFRPVMISISMTPKLNTSDLVVTRPVTGIYRYIIKAIVQLSKRQTEEVAERKKENISKVSQWLFG